MSNDLTIDSIIAIREAVYKNDGIGAGVAHRVLDALESTMQREAKLREALKKALVRMQEDTWDIDYGDSKSTELKKEIDDLEALLASCEYSDV